MVLGPVLSSIANAPYMPLKRFVKLRDIDGFCIRLQYLQYDSNGDVAFLR